MKWFFIAIAVLLGFFTGQWVETTVLGTSKDRSGREGSEFNAAHDGAARVARKNTQRHSVANQLLWQETTSLHDWDTFRDEVASLHKEARSPLRAKSFLSFHVQESTYDELVEALYGGRIRRPELLGEVATRMAREDVLRTLSLFETKKLVLGSMDNLYAFRDPILRHWADTAAADALEYLKAMERGGNQMDASLYFSQYWANNDPQAAVEHFSDLVKLRNMQMQGSLELPGDRFAMLLMRSWIHKDPVEAERYVEALPVGGTRSSLQRALTNLSVPAETDATP